MSLLVFWSACFCWLVVTGADGASLNCSCSGNACCSEVEELPSCTSSKKHLPYCKRNYQRWKTPQLYNILEESHPLETCTDSNRLVQYCGHSPTDDRQLEVKGVTHSELEANLTVSWQHLNLSLSPGSVIDIRLYKMPYCDRSSQCIVESGCVQRLFCTNDTTRVSYTFVGAKFHLMNEVQMAVRRNSNTVLLLRTTFAPTAGDFKCTNRSIVDFNANRCPPPPYGNVTSLAANVSWYSGYPSAVVSWQPPAEEGFYRVSLFYHVVIRKLDQQGAAAMNLARESIFSVRPRSDKSGSVTLYPLHDAAAYSIGVRAYVNCSSCLVSAMAVIKINVSTPTPPGPSSSAAAYVSISSLLTPTPPGPSSSSAAYVSTSSLLTPTPSFGPPSSANSTNTNSLAIVLPVNVSVIFLLVCTAIAGTTSLILCKKKSKSCCTRWSASSDKVTPQSNQGPSTPPPPTIKDPVIQHPTISCIPPELPLNLWDFKPGAGCMTGKQSNSDYLPNTPIDPLQQHTAEYFMGRPPPRDGNCYNTGISECSFSLNDASETASSNSSEFFCKQKVLIIYSPNNEEAENLAVRKLFAQLSLNRELVIVSHDLESHDVALSNWLMAHLDKEGEDRVHTVLCVWTEMFRAEWYGEVDHLVNSDLVRAAKRVLDNGNTTKKFKMATILLDSKLPVSLPTSLNTGKIYQITNIHGIETFIKGVASFSTQ